MPTLDRPVTLYRVANAASGELAEYASLHAEVNCKARRLSESEGAERSVATRTFRVRYSALLKEVAYDMQSYMLAYDGWLWRITGYDDYQEMHQYVTLEAVAYGRHD